MLLSVVQVDEVLLIFTLSNLSIINALLKWRHRYETKYPMLHPIQDFDTIQFTALVFMHSHPVNASTRSTIVGMVKAINQLIGYHVRTRLISPMTGVYGAYA